MAAEILYFLWRPLRLRLAVRNKLAALLADGGTLALVWGGFRLEQDWDAFLQEDGRLRLSGRSCMAILSALSASRSSSPSLPRIPVRAMTIDLDARPDLEKIDAVYLWVDGADPCFQRELALHTARYSGFLPGEAIPTIVSATTMNCAIRCAPWNFSLPGPGTSTSSRTARRRNG